MKNRTNAEIKKEIKRLKTERKTIREYSIFGDANWENIDSEVDLYERYLKLEINVDNLEGMLFDIEEDASMEDSETDYDKISECPVKHVLDFIQGY